jgi:intracellular septation protein A
MINFDLRIPLGLIFIIFGLILMGVGIFGGAELIRQSMGINVNLWWGLVQFCFGAVMLFLSFRTKPKKK